MNLEDLRDDSTFWPALQKLQECLCQELAEAGGPALCYCGFSVGQPPLGLMDCKDKPCGVAWVTPVTVFPSNSFPSPQDPGQDVSCKSRLVMQVEVGVARCAPKIAKGSSILDPQSAYNSMRVYLSDMQAIRRAILCCLPKEVPGVQVSVEAWTPMEPQGGAAGGSWVAYIG